MSQTFWLRRRCGGAGDRLREAEEPSFFFALQREEPVEERPFRAVKSECLEEAL